MEHTEDGQPFLIVPVGDSADSRLFIELSSYGSDLAEARHALHLAIRGFEEESDLADASRHLVGLAVVAYCRAVLHSNVRGRLTDHVAVPDGFVRVHDLVKTYRNATVAHSQSELAVTYAVGVLETDTLRVRDVTGPTVLVPLPNRVVRDFLELIDVMERRLDLIIEPVRHRLMKKLGELDRRRVEAAVRPEITEKWAHEFNPRTKRPRYPSGHTLYWDVADYEAVDE
ncbi:hypothetical protein [Ornithinimicrobium sediminis]|uniref:hypothetical protein n=1 Tax=Ornithinimicrobium sediminis TaxID=2904603 RepID=UPI001E330A3A|nr:hypothetical protein [Ornithinimicrobium sediminis]MCE0485451.1 hypothetical protein [Ornithinimicrobium sediminis]